MTRKPRREHDRSVSRGVDVAAIYIAAV